MRDVGFKAPHKNYDLQFHGASQEKLAKQV